MKLEFDRINLKKIDIDFSRKEPSKENNSRMIIERVKQVQENKKTKQSRLNIRSTYIFNIEGNDNILIFEAYFKILDESLDEKTIESSKLDEIIELIIFPQEVLIAKNLLLLFGADVKDTLLLGVPFNV